MTILEHCNDCNQTYQAQKGHTCSNCPSCLALRSINAELLEALKSAQQTLHNLGQGELHGEVKIIAYNASQNAGRAIRKAYPCSCNHSTFAGFHDSDCPFGIYKAKEGSA